MGKIAIFYGTEQGHTRSVAQRIAAAFGDPVPDVIDVAEARAADLERYDSLVLGAPSWGVGQLCDSWEQLLPDLEDVSLAGKRVALFGLGDQQGHPESFVEALHVLHEAVSARGATIVGSWPTEGYEFLVSSAVRDGRFVGLALDEASQSELTDDRVRRWVAEVSDELTGGGA
jgi:flavodoxin long chain